MVAGHHIQMASCLLGFDSQLFNFTMTQVQCTHSRNYCLNFASFLFSVKVLSFNTGQQQWVLIPKQLLRVSTQVVCYSSKLCPLAYVYLIQFLFRLFPTYYEHSRSIYSDRSLDMSFPRTVGKRKGELFKYWNQKLDLTHFFLCVLKTLVIRN